MQLDDASLQVRLDGTTKVLGEQNATVRIRKNAILLTDGERDRFLAALGTLNNQGAGRFRDFYEMHVLSTLEESHGDVGFLSWHRAYLLDLERELQKIDPSVTLPYWRFDEPAPSLFKEQFLGRASETGRVMFSAGHALEGWSTVGVQGVTRTPRFPTEKAPSDLRSETATVALGGPLPNAEYARFVNMEENPHGWAHTSFGGLISVAATSPRDPLFFLLHCNVDRLWAKWQWIHRRTDPAEPRAFAASRIDRIGHRLDDTMWPWNGEMGDPRPDTAPGGPLASSPITAEPGDSPKVRTMLDFQAVGGGGDQGFAYDDVPL